jgi:endogenous inhibitor of DNA gyrase (YacG/DUF329 family)
MNRMDRPPVCAACRLHPVEPRWRPFCSRRCQQEDLARWADGTYRVPGPAVTTDEQPEDDDF